MATITQRTNKAGKERFTAQIRIKRDDITHTEAKTFGSRKAAERWAAAREQELLQPGALKRAQSSGITLGDLIRRYLGEFCEGYGRSKLADLNRLARSEIATLPADSLQSSDYVQHTQARLATGVKPQTANNDLAWLRVVAKTARAAWGADISLQAIEDAAVLCRKRRLISRPDKRDRRPTIDELNTLLDWFEAGRGVIPMVDVVLFALFSGRRQEEITKLLLADYDRTRKTIVVRDAKDPRHKKGNHITVSLTEEACRIIDRQPPGERIFPYNHRSISTGFARACKLTGIKGLVFHSLRHECASWLIERGWSIPSVAQVTGHRHWATLQRYTHLQGPEPVDKYDGWKWRP